MARPRKQPQGGTPDNGAQGVVERTLNQINPGIAEREDRRLRLDKAYSVWRGEPWNPVVNPQRLVAQNTWQSRLRVKWAMSVTDQALANIVQGVPHAKVTPRQKDSEDKAVAMEKLLAYYADQDHLAEKEMLVGQQALIYGISPAKTHWLYTEEASTQYAEVTDPETGEVRWKPTQKMVVTADRPTMEPWDAYAIFWDPTAGSVDDCAYIVLESWKTKDELEQGRFNSEDGTGQWRNLDLLYQTGDGGKPYEKAQNQLMLEPAGANRGKFRIWEVWRKTAAGMRLTVIGNRSILLRDGPSPYWMNGYPITISNSRPDMFKIEGIKETELVDHLQQWMWTIHNLRAEQWKFSVMRGATVRQTVPDMAALVMRPGFLWPVTDHDDVKFQDQPQLPPAAYQEEQASLSMMQLVTGINQYVTGGPGANTNDTATGASLFTQSASRLLQMKATVIHNLTWQRTFEQWAMLTKQFLRRDQEIRVVGPGGTIDWLTVGPEVVNADYDVKIEAGDESITKQQDRADKIAFLNAVAPFVQMGVVNLQPILKALAADFGFSDPDAVVNAATQPPQAAPFTPNGGGGPPPVQGPSSPFILGTNGGAQGVPQLAPQPLGSLYSGNQQ